MILTLGYCSRPVCVCVCVCVSVPALAASVSAYIRNQRYSRVSLRRFLDFDLSILEKNLPLKSYAVKKPICKLVRAHREPFSRSFGTNETQQLREGQLVGRMLLQSLATGATGVKQVKVKVKVLLFSYLIQGRVENSETKRKIM